MFLLTSKQLPPLSNSVVLLNGLNDRVYLNIKILTKSQLLYKDYSHYSSYQEFLFRLCNTLKDRGLGYRKISHYLNDKGYKTPREKTFKNNHVYSIIKKGKVRKDRIKNLKSHKDYGYEFETYILNI